MPISVFRSGGLSDINFFQRTYESWKVVTRYRKGLNFTGIIYGFFSIILRIVI